MLKKWYSKEKSFVSLMTDEQDKLQYPHLEQQDVEEAQFLKSLTSEQQEQLQHLLKEHSEIIWKQGLRQRPYRLLPAVKEEVIK